MATDSTTTGQRSASIARVTLRQQPGDLGWIVNRHGVLYASEYGNDHRFEAIVVGVAAEFLESPSPRPG